LPINESKLFYILVQRATVVSGTGAPPFTADIGIAANRRVRVGDGQRRIQMQANISDLGDLRTYGALRAIDAQGLVAAPLWDPAMKEGQEIDLPDFSQAPSPRTIAPGQPGELVLLRPANDPSKPASRYVVDIILRY
jgi:hypothetical protein